MSSTERSSPESTRLDRIGSVPYLNAIPLTYGIEHRVTYATPSALATLLRRGQLDTALVSVTEFLQSDRYRVLDGVAVGSDGPVLSVLLAHRQPLKAIAEIACDPASLTSVNLLRILLTERGLNPKFVPLDRYEEAVHREAVLLIGDPALAFLQSPHAHQVWDLGSAWKELTGLPFVYAAWTIGTDAVSGPLCRLLTRAKQHGLANLERIIRRDQGHGVEFLRGYLTDHIRFDLGEREKKGLGEFARLLRKHQLSPGIEPTYVSPETFP